TQLDQVWRERRDDVTQQTTALTAALAEKSTEELTRGLSVALLDDIALQLPPHLDGERGGFQGAPKFPMPFVFDFLWKRGWKLDRPELRDAVTLTLDQICQGGIYDHAGGGFARYSTDAAWLVPHFEKMLYDNAALLELLTHAWQDSHTPLYEQRIRETVGWLLREMRVAPAGDGAASAFASAL